MHIFMKEIASDWFLINLKIKLILLIIHALFVITRFLWIDRKNYNHYIYILFMFHTPLPKPDFCHTNTFAHYWALFCSLVLCQVSFLDNSWTIERFSHWIQTGIFVLHVKLALRTTFAQAQNFSEKHPEVSQKRKAWFLFGENFQQQLGLIIRFDNN